MFYLCVALFITLKQGKAMNSQKKSNQNFNKKRIAFIQSCWHKNIVDQARNSFQQELKNLNDYEIDFFELPGAFELPLKAKQLAKSGQYSGVVAAGFVVDGGIYRHDFVANAVINGLMQVQLDVEIPVFSVVLTPHNFQESQEHIHFFTQHFIEKGKEAAHAVQNTIGTELRIAS